MKFKIAIAGKGGTGKTTLASLFIRNIIEAEKGNILALDADPNSNLNELLGVKIEGTVGQLVEDFKKNGAVISSGLYKDQAVEMNIHRIITEGKGFDLLVMGRGEGPGCYCAANNLFKKYIDVLQQNYPVVVMDNEAGMEHLSRKTTQNMDYLLIVSDPSPRGIMAAKRIKELAGELNIKAGKILLVVNRVGQECYTGTMKNNGNPEKIADESTEVKEAGLGLLDDRILSLLEGSGLEVTGIVENDASLADMELDGRNIFDLLPDSISLKQTGQILKKLNII